MKRGVTDPGKSVTGRQEAVASAAGAAVAGVAAAFAVALRAVPFFLPVAFAAADFLASFRFFGLVIPLAGVVAAGRLAALFTLAQRFF
ncbi:MAG TPA: hypothetical protein VJP83_03115 [Terriglobales bacterium]|nr:hypothetical protein [Terriglobales bacterium]